MLSKMFCIFVDNTTSKTHVTAIHTLLNTNLRQIAAAKAIFVSLNKTIVQDAGS